MINKKEEKPSIGYKFIKGLVYTAGFGSVAIFCFKTISQQIELKNTKDQLYKMTAIHMTDSVELKKRNEHDSIKIGKLTGLLKEKDYALNFINKDKQIEIDTYKTTLFLMAKDKKISEKTYTTYHNEAVDHIRAEKTNHALREIKNHKEMFEIKKIKTYEEFRQGLPGREITCLKTEPYYPLLLPAPAPIK